MVSEISHINKKLEDDRHRYKVLPFYQTPETIEMVCTRFGREGLIKYLGNPVMKPFIKFYRHGLYYDRYREIAWAEVECGGTFFVYCVETEEFLKLLREYSWERLTTEQRKHLNAVYSLLTPEQKKMLHKDKLKREMNKTYWRSMRIKIKNTKGIKPCL